MWVYGDNNVLGEIVFKVAMADVPYRFRNARAGGSLSSGSSQKYDVMDLEDIKSLPMQDIMDRNSLLLYWTPSSMTQESLEVIHAWGYDYVTAVYWVKTQKHNPEKVRMGMGYNVRGAVEECWICRRGKVPALRIQKPNVVFAPIGKHSEKPVAMYEFFEPALDRLELSPRLDLFARTQRSGWIAVGNEIDGCDVREVLANVS